MYGILSFVFLGGPCKAGPGLKMGRLNNYIFWSDTAQGKSHGGGVVHILTMHLRFTLPTPSTNHQPSP